MSQFRIYNTNKIQVYPETQQVGVQENIKDYVNNAIEYVVDTTEKKIISLVRADAPQVEGRDKANFYVEFEADRAEELPSQFVSRLNQHQSDTDWEFHTSEPRWRIPWFIAESDLTSRDRLDHDIGRTLAVEKSVQNNESLDLGFKTYETAGAVINYFLQCCSQETTLAVATNGRKRTIQSAEIVLQPGAYDNFESLNERTENLVSDQFADLKATAESSYIETPVRNVKAVEQAAESKPIRALKDLNRLYRYTEKGVTRDDETYEYRTEEAQSVIPRIEALRTGERYESGPLARVLPGDRRKEGIIQIADDIERRRSSLLEETSEVVTEKIDEQLHRLVQHSVDSAHARVITLEETTPATESEPVTQYDSVNIILRLIVRVQSVAIGDFDKQRLVRSINNRISETKQEIRERKLAGYTEAIDSWKTDLPRANRSNSDEIAVYIRKFQSGSSELARVAGDSDLFEESVTKFNAIVSHLLGGEVLTQQQRKRVQQHFTTVIREYREEARHDTRQSYQENVSDTIRSKSEGLTKPEEHDRLEKSGYVFVDEYRSGYDYHGDFQEIIRNVGADRLLTQDQQKAVIQNLKAQLDDRKETVIGEYFQEKRSEINRCRDRFVDDCRDRIGIWHAIEELNQLGTFMRSTGVSMPDVQSISQNYYSHLLDLKFQRGDILTDSTCRELKQHVETARNNKIDELRAEYKTRVRERLEQSLEKTANAIDGKDAIKLLETVKQILAGVKNSQNRHVSPSRGSRRSHIAESRKFVNDLNQKLPPGVEFRNELHERKHRDRLSSSEIDEIRAHGIRKAEQLVQSAQQDFIDRSVTDLRNHIETSILQGTHSMEPCIDALQRLEHIQSHINSVTVKDTIAPATERRLFIFDDNLLTDSHEQDFHNRIIEFTNGEIETLETQLEAMFDQKCSAYLETVESEEDSRRKRILAYNELEVLLEQPNTREFDRIDDTLVHAARLLNGEYLRESRQNKRETTVEKKRKQVTRMAGDITDTLKREQEQPENPVRALGKFKRVVRQSGKPNTVSGLREACQGWKEFEDLYKRHHAMSKSTYQSEKEQLISVIIELS